MCSCVTLGHVYSVGAGVLVAGCGQQAQASCSFTACWVAIANSVYHRGGIIRLTAGCVAGPDVQHAPALRLPLFSILASVCESQVKGVIGVGVTHVGVTCCVEHSCVMTADKQPPV